MTIKNLTFSILAMTLICSSVFAEQGVQTYKNQRGSLLELEIIGDNKIQGFFTTAVASKSCPEAIGKKQPIIGYTVGNALTFSVVYPSCGSVVSITGNFLKKQSKIDTLSIVNHQSNNVTHEGPDSRFIGHDRYHKVD
ncbi:MAG: hypothetical protein H0U70_04350 [Tatlockia sp.]|nr:hypothetical protein [Tatlockia sp.]